MKPITYRHQDPEKQFPVMEISQSSLSEKTLDPTDSSDVERPVYFYRKEKSGILHESFSIKNRASDKPVTRRYTCKTESKIPDDAPGQSFVFCNAESHKDFATFKHKYPTNEKENK